MGLGGGKIEPYSYRLFSKFTDKHNIVPENIGRCFIETKLNPTSMRPVYEDKNMFPYFLGRDNVPATVLCRIGGGPILDCNFHPIHNDFVLNTMASLILKPSTGGLSGRGIHLFTFSDYDGVYISKKDNSKLSKEFLISYGENFVLQEVVTQHAAIARFNPTSVNTLRMAVYRSWKDEEPHVLASVMRIGKSGAFVDNAHAGGMFVGINAEDGKVGERLFDPKGNSTSVWNGIDFSGNDFYIPEWDAVKKFVCDLSRKIIHHRLFAFDICLNSESKPIVIEYNLQSFSYWLFMYTDQCPFGDYTDEIIEFCKNKVN